GFFNTLFAVAGQVLNGNINGEQADLLQNYLGRADVASGILGDPLSYLSAELGAPENITTTYVGSASTAGTSSRDPWNTQYPGKAAISGTVDVLIIDNAATGSIGPNARINLGLTAPTDSFASLNLADPTALAATLAAQAGKTISTTDPVSYYIW